jgi:phosphatidylinositol glycan class U
MYYCNPIAILATSCTHSPSFQGVIYMFLLIAIRESMAISTVGTKRRALRSTAFLAFASYFEPYNVVYLLPIAIWIGRSSDGTQWNRGLVGVTIGLFCFCFGLLQVVSVILVEDYTSVLAKTYGYVHGFFVMNPNMGLSWYFFIQMFDRFRRYFVAMFNLLQFIFVAPLAIRLHKYPIVLTTAFFLLGTLFKPVQTLHDAALGLALVAMAPRTVSRMGNASLVSLFAIIVPASLVVMFYWLWLETGTGNANYIFFQCLAYNVFLSIITLDYISATVKRDKALRLTEKVELQGGGAANTCKNKSD